MMRESNKFYWALTINNQTKGTSAKIYKGFWLFLKYKNLYAVHNKWSLYLYEKRMPSLERTASVSSYLEINGESI
ncbi:hypothetical protein J2T13_001565 [Paenibacillus sp. DS2015]